MNENSYKLMNRLIVALDVPSGKEARSLVYELNDSVSFYKVGLELFCSGDGFETVDWLAEQGKDIFVDLKLFDVPETVSRAIRQLSKKAQIRFTTVHGDEAIMSAAVKASKGIDILAVTVLTSMDSEDFSGLGFKPDISSMVQARAQRAIEIGCSGGVASGLEAKLLRDSLGSDAIIVTPGIRMAAVSDDQKRTVSPAEAILAGSDYIVVGRPIRDADNPKDVVREIQNQIESANLEKNLGKS